MGDCDPHEIRPSVPIFQISRDQEFVRPVHGVVDRLAQQLGSSRDRLRQRVQPAPVLGIEELLDQRLILRIV